MIEKLTSESTRIKVSSVVQKSPQFSGKNVLTDDTSTCWSSDSGSPQYILIDFEKDIIPAEVRIMFQGGFSGSEIVLYIGSSSDSSCMNIISKFEAEDSNDLQIFAIEPPLEAKNKSRFMRIEFLSSSDFYGRVIVYKLEVYGNNSVAI